MHTSVCALAGRPELAFSAGLSWGAFLVAIADQAEPATAPAGWQRATAFFLSLASGLALAAFGFNDADDRTWRVYQGGVLAVARAAPLVFGLGLFLWRTPLSELRRRAFPLSALLCPLVTPVPGWLRLRVDHSLFSAWGAEQALRLAGQPVDRQGMLLVLPRAELMVDSECSGLGAVLQLLAIVVMLAVLTRAPWRRVALLVSLAVVVGLLVNFARLALLARLLENGDLDRFGYWHMGPGALLYSSFSSSLVLGAGLPLTVGRARAPRAS